MDHFKILKRAGDITWQYRALWVFGIILALVTGGTSGNAGGGGGNGGGNGNGPGMTPPNGFQMPEISPEIVGIITIVAIVLVVLIVLFMMLAFLLIVVSAIARYVAETSLIRMVNDHEATGEKRSVLEGLKMGWSRSAWRIFLIGLLIDLPIAIVFIALFILSAAPLLLWITENVSLGIMGTVAAVGVFFLLIFLAIIVGTVTTLLKRFFWRACVIEELGVFDALRQGYAIVRQNLKDVAIMWLIMAGLNIGWALVMFLVVLLLVVLAMIIGGLPILLVGSLSSLIFDSAIPWIIGAAIGIPLFILILAIPLTFLNGLWEVFKSTTWTLTYRELTLLNPEEAALEVPSEENGDTV